MLSLQGSTSQRCQCRRYGAAPATALKCAHTGISTSRGEQMSLIRFVETACSTRTHPCTHGHLALAVFSRGGGSLSASGWFRCIDAAQGFRCPIILNPALSNQELTLRYYHQVFPGKCEEAQLGMLVSRTASCFLQVF